MAREVRRQGDEFATIVTSKSIGDELNFAGGLRLQRLTDRVPFHDESIA
jgi:hypothetical protein